MHLDLLIKYLDTDHRSTLVQIQNLQDHVEVNFDLLWYILVPRTLFYLLCPISGEPRVAKLITSKLKTGAFDQKYWEIELEYTNSTGAADDNSPAFGRSTLSEAITYFKGTKKITSLTTFPLKYHPQAEQLEERLIERGLKWARLNGCHHMRYDGVAYQHTSHRKSRVKVSVSYDLAILSINILIGEQPSYG